MKRIQSVPLGNYMRDAVPKLPESTFMQGSVSNFSIDLLQAPLIDTILPQPRSQKKFYAKVSTPTKKNSKTKRVRRTKKSV